MNLDIKVPMGWFFLITGLLIAGYGLIADPAIYVQRSLGYNVNLYWGIVLAVFGAGCLFFRNKPKKS
ncbi:MAG: hypothetical protein RL376_577 [Verrucomicrobiota bacterium]|jgi:hypothetical protein